MSNGYDYLSGVTDDPVELMKEDSLSMKKQINGFSKYIMTCPTPLTISIQGSWGSGKTSFFRMIRNKIEKYRDAEIQNNCIFLEFNAWQYSQFNKDSELPVSLMTFITSQIDIELKNEKKSSSIIKSQDKVLNGLKNAVSVVGSIGNIVLDKVTGINVGKEIENFDKNREEINQILNGVNAISKLQKDFQEYVKNVLEKKFEDADDITRKNARLVIFIDDLDRLLPDKAVELLDTIKIFLDCPGCVFVLAVDYEVVIKGVEKKYNHEISREKANDYFEKIIQVVYRLPEKMASMKKYIYNLLNKMDINVSVAEEFSKLISAAGKDTPRNVKRLINNFYLIKTIDDRKFNDESKEEKTYFVYLFAVMLMREVYFEKYMELYSSMDNINAKLTQMYMDKDNDEIGVHDQYMNAFLQAIDNFSGCNGNIIDCVDDDMFPVSEYLGYNYVIGKSLVTVIKALNYSEGETITVDRVKITSNQFKASGEGNAKLTYYNNVKGGKVVDAYMATISLLAGLCTDAGIDKICQEVGFISRNQRDSSYKRIEYRKQHIEGVNSFDDPLDPDIEKLIEKNKKDIGKLYVLASGNEDIFIERIRELANLLEITVSWHRDKNDNKGVAIFGDTDKKNNDKSYDKINRLYDYLDFGYIEFSQIDMDCSWNPLYKKRIITLYDLKGKTYEDLLKIYKNDRASVNKLVTAVAKYGVVIE